MLRSLTRAGALALAATFAPMAAQAQEASCLPAPHGFEARNKAAIAATYQDLFGPADLDSLGARFAEACIQHDPKIAEGRAGMVAWIQAQRAVVPAQTIVVKHILADRDLVLVHAQLTATPNDDTTGRDRFDLYRLDNGLVVEHWSVSQRVYSPSASGNSMFSDLYVPTSRPHHVGGGLEAANRTLVVGLANAVFGQRRFDLVDRFWAVNYLQHNPFVETGRAAFESVLDYIAPEGSHYCIVQSVAEGDLVWVFSQNVDPGDDPTNEFTGAAVCDLYRVVDFQLVEHWDAAQGVPPASLSGHSMFSDLYHR